jgi:hypothetical protein
MTVKRKISVTVAADVLALVDQEARVTGTTRSYTIERWLRGSSLRAAERSLEDATAAYYASLREDERRDAEELALASSKAATRVRYDEPPRRRGRGRTA